MTPGGAPADGRTVAPRPAPARLAAALGTALVAAVLVLAFLWFTARVLLLGFAAIVLGVCLRGLAEWVAEKTRLSRGHALTLVLLALLAAAVAGTWFMGSAVAAQSAELSETLPGAIVQLRQRIVGQPWGERLLALVSGADGSGQRFARYAQGMLGGGLGGMLDALVVVVLGIFLAASPRLYVEGMLALLPARRRERIGQVLHELAHVHRRWMAGRLSVMTINGILSWLGLWALGVPLPFLLGMLTGLLNFIPNLGPFLAAVPPLLLALSISPTKALYVAILYAVIQNLEGFVLTPLVQHRSVSLPPALILFSQLVMGVLAGALGVLVATPVSATLLVMVQMLYVRDVLGHPVTVAGRKAEDGDEGEGNDGDGRGGKGHGGAGHDAGGKSG